MARYSRFVAGEDWRVKIRDAITRDALVFIASLMPIAMKRALSAGESPDFAAIACPNPIVAPTSALAAATIPTYFKARVNIPRA